MGEHSYVIRGRLGQLRFGEGRTLLLKRLDIDLTERCNNGCIHCYINRPADDLEALSRELSAEEVIDILHEAASLGCFTVRLTGGEPLLRDDFDEIYISARKLGLAVIVATNATLITPERAALFARIPPLEKIEVSLYGMTQETYEAVSGISGSYDAAMRGLHLLVTRQIPLVVITAFFPSLRDEEEEIVALARSGLRWLDQSSSYTMLLDLRGRRDSEGKNRRIHKLRLPPEEAMRFFLRKKKDYLQEMREFCSKFLEPPGDKLFSCGAGVKTGCVDAFGGFQLCLLLRHPDSVYDLKSGSLKDALMEFVPRIRDMRAKNAVYLVRCARCFLKSLCGQCPAKSWVEHGTLDSPVRYLCDLAQIQARYVGILGEDEVPWDVTNWKDRIRHFVGSSEISPRSMPNKPLHHKTPSKC